MIRIPLILLITAFAFMACKSTEDAAGRNDMDNVESIGIEKNNGDQGVEGQGDDSKLAEPRFANAKQVMTKITGDWAWVKTACCGRMMGETFPKEDEPLRIISFDGKGNASYFSDETKEKVSDLTYTFGSLGPSQPTINIGEMQPALIMIDGDQLVLSWGYIDLHMEYYQRVKK